MAGEDKAKVDYEQVYKHPSWKAESIIFEQQFARKLYDQEPVREAGSTALSRISRLLVRYNRLKSIESLSDTIRGEKQSIGEVYSNSITRLKGDLERIEKEITKEGITEDEKKKLEERKADLEKKIREVEAEKAEKERKIDAAADASEVEALKFDIDLGGGRVLSSLMLGGDAEGARGYNLSASNDVDVLKGGRYISEVSGEQGTLFDQMSLFDNAVNSEGLDLGGDKVANFQDIVSGISEKDVEKMNRGAGTDVSFDLSLKGKDGFKNFGGKRNGEERPSRTGVTKDLFALRETEEAKKRRRGKTVGQKPVVTKEEKKELKKQLKTEKKYFKGIDMAPTSFFGGFGSYFARRGNAVRFKNGWTMNKESKKREQVRSEAFKFFEKHSINLDDRKLDSNYNDIVFAKEDKPAESVKVNKNDSSAALKKALPAKDLDAITGLEKSGFIKSTPDGLLQLSGDGKAKKDGEKPDEKAMEAVNQNSAANMINAFRLLGAKPEEIAMFRLSLIAYMIPTGKKTLYDILTETKDAGGEEGIDMSEPALMYTSFVADVKKLLNKDITLAPKPEKQASKMKEKKEAAAEGEVKDAKETEEVIPDKTLIPLPMDVIKEYIKREAKQKRFARNFRNLGKEAPDSPIKPVSRDEFEMEFINGFISLHAVEKSKAKDETEEKELDKRHDKPSDNAKARIYERAFSAEEFKICGVDIVGTEGAEDLAKIVSDKLCEIVNKEELTRIVEYLSAMLDDGKEGEEERFWKFFIGSFVGSFVYKNLTELDKEEFEEKIKLIEKELSEKKSGFKELVIGIYKGL